ncbi:MAG: DUF5615 family PIN-like protein [Mucilaginibacter sp.]|nr:DUF5615 family PIN-like protein [Mucilaginibacter sp.]
MKILIDEQLPTKLKYRFIEANLDVYTVRDMEWLGTKNGDLLQLMADNYFDVLLTNDKNLYYQQKVETLKVCIVNVNAKTNRYDDVFDLMDAIKSKLKEVEVWLKNNTGGYFIF